MADKPSLRGFLSEPSSYRDMAHNLSTLVNRNAVGLAGMPVDVTNWLLERAGLGSAEPVGGSDWLKRRATALGIDSGGSGDDAADAWADAAFGLATASPAAVARLGARAGLKAESALARAATNAAAPRTLHPQAGVIKLPGGNWDPRVVKMQLFPMRDNATEARKYNELRQLDRKRDDDFADWYNAKRAVNPNYYSQFAFDRHGNQWGFNAFNQYAKETGAAPLTIDEPAASLNRWVDKKLDRYLRNEMATPNDPLRALAERGVTHFPRADDLRVNAMLQQHTLPEGALGRRRADAGFPAEGEAQSALAKAWEDLADVTVRRRTKSDYMFNPPDWVQYVKPDEYIYMPDQDFAQHTQFQHLVDELRNAVNPDSGLPPQLRWKYSDLDKVTVPQAVQRVHDINQWRAAQKAEADLARSTNVATQTFKEYPEQGYRWVEIRTPELPEGFTIEKDAIGVERLRGPGVDTLPGNLSDPRRSALEDALKYEGEQMGHCVGGYCPDVMEGRSRIFSLRDAKGRPHVTIEVGRSKPWNERSGIFYENPELEDPWREFHNAMLDKGGASPNIQGFPSWLEQNKPDVMERYRSVFEPSPPPIIQIKGKANLAPKDEYLPYVQDFVRSGRWSEARDLENARMARIGDHYVDLDEFRKVAGENLNPRYFNALVRDKVTDVDDTDRAILRALKIPGYARGGLVGLKEALKHG